MTGTVDSFLIGIKVNSFNCDSSVLSEALEILPSVAIRKGKQLGPIVAKRSSWFGTFRQGVGNEEFGVALEDLLTFMVAKRDFFNRLRRDGAETTVSIGEVIAFDEGIVLQLRLEPEFLQACGSYGFSLQVEAWASDEKAGISSAQVGTLESTRNEAVAQNERDI